jgi:CHAT domain-containing protein
VTRLIVVPHSALTYLPFAALLDRDGHALIERRALLTLQSASALPFIRSGAAASPQGYSIFAPFPNELTGSMADAQFVSREVAKPKSYIGNRGTEKQLRAMLEREGNIHVASHALLNWTNPMFSHVELASGGSEDPSDDGRLDVHELLQMNVKAGLVYLSGCETGAGASWMTFRREQDYATLSQALLFAGAQNVVATLWRIDDAGASVFAGRFYRALRTGDVVEALAQAQRETLSDPRYSAPRYWAGYTVSGSGISKPVSQNVARAAVQ